MIRYELKDKERQAALEKALPGFTEALQNNCEAQFNDPTSFVNATIRICEGGFNVCIVSIQKDAILAKETYDPYRWNRYPEVTPPERIPMRVEYNVPLMTVFQRGGLAVFEGGNWYECIPSGRHKISQFKNGRRVVRFRPWDDEK